MSQKIKLKTISGPMEPFTVPVVVKNLQGAEVEFVFTCMARSRTEWAPIKKEVLAVQMDEARRTAEEAKAAAAKAGEAAKDDAAKWDGVLESCQKFEALDVASVVVSGIDKAVGFAQRIATGWDLEDEMNADTLRQFEDKFPGGLQLLIDKYDAAIQGAREKN
jgi:hypothetical protein